MLPLFHVLCALNGLAAGNIERFVVAAFLQELWLSLDMFGHVSSMSNAGRCRQPAYVSFSLFLAHREMQFLSSAWQPRNSH